MACDKNVRLLALLALALVASTHAMSSSPMGMLQQWRQMRLQRFREAFDCSRYHTQVLFVDDDGSRARACEAILERIAEWADAGWWIYPHSASIGIVADGDAAPPSLRQTADRFSLSRARMEAGAARLDRSDLDSYDLIVCVDLSVQEQARARGCTRACPQSGASLSKSHVIALSHFPGPCHVAPRS